MRENAGVIAIEFHRAAGQPLCFLSFLNRVVIPAPRLPNSTMPMRLDGMREGKFGIKVDRLLKQVQRFVMIFRVNR